MSQLCRVCKHINFAAILTPRERDSQTGEWRTIYHPEMSGNGNDPCLGWPRPDKVENSSRHEDRVPHIRNVQYDQLSDATRSSDDEDEGESEAEVETSELSPEFVEFVGRDMSDEDDMDEVGDERDSYPGQDEENDDLQGQSHKDGGPEFDLEDDEHDRAGGPERSSRKRAKSSTSQELSDIQSGRNISEHEYGEDLNHHPNRPARDLASDSVGHSNDWNEQKSSNCGTSSFTWSADSRFSRYQKIDIDQQSQGNWAYKHGQFYNLGSIWDVRSRRSECDLCFQLWLRMRNDWAVKNMFLEKNRCLLKLLEWKVRPNEDEPARKVVMLNMLFIFGFCIEGRWNIRLSYVFHGTHKDSHAKTEISLSDCRPQWRDNMFGEARALGTSCDFDLLKKWLAFCEDEHRHEEPEITGDMMIRLIDVHQRCLVEWKGSNTKVPRFVALSYVWGKRPQPLLLTTENVTNMKKPGFLEPDVLPRTIDDAIDLVRRIGQRFLWVDALCILQNSREDKDIQLPQMYNIYTKAACTIVAANGQDANTGLPGVQRSSRPTPRFCLDLEDIQVRIRPSTKLWQTQYNIGFKENYLSGCTYLTRAWTLQEALLSRRTLVFTQDQVYWECAAGTWCEGTHWESSSLRFVGQRAIKESTPEDVWEDNFDREAYDMINPDIEEVTYEVQPNSYESLVRQYTDRSLTNDSDILGAFTGILGLIEKRERTKFSFALRRRHFGNDLLFNINTATLRRLTVQEAKIPSWSWLAWRGTAEFANEARNSSSDIVNNLIPCDGVRCYFLEIDENGHKCLRVINGHGGWQFNSTYVRRGEGIYDLTFFHSIPTKGNAEDEFNVPTKGQVHDKVDAWAANVEANSNNSLPPTDLLPYRDPPPSRLPTESKDQSRHTGQPPNLPATNQPQSKLSKSAGDILEYSQDLSLAEIQSHKAFPLLQPNFHIIFRTFSSTVELRTEEDSFTKLLSTMIMGGTKRQRRHGINSNRDIIQRNLYLDTKEPDELAPTTRRRRRAEDRIFAMLKHEQAQRSRGPYFGRIPEFSKAWDRREYEQEVPDGVYTVLWMNNNQLPMFGHILCRPVDASSGRERVDGVLERVCGVVGPTEILTREAQEKWKAKWGCYVLG